MKYLCFILAFLVMTLSLQPVCMAGSQTVADCCSESTCPDDKDCCDSNDEHKECANCNPFQMCGCCSFSIVPPVRVSLEFRERVNIVTHSWATLGCTFVEEPVLGFWQPPKLS